MIFYVYLDPEVITVAGSEGEYGCQALIGVLRGFLQNCFLVDFTDGRVGTALKEKAQNLPESSNKKDIEVLLATLQKRNRFIYCVSTDGPQAKDNLTYVKEQESQIFVDLILVPNNSDKFEAKTAEVSSIFTYQGTRFEAKRSELASDGVTLKAGEYKELDLLEEYLKRALIHASSIAICDKNFGRYYGGNYEYTTRVLLNWLERVLDKPSMCRLIIHCEEPGQKARPLEELKRQLSACKKLRLSRLGMSLQLYKQSDVADNLPHDRFIITDQVAIGIPRGLDFLDRKTKRNRDLTMDYKSKKKIDELLEYYFNLQQQFIDL